MKSLVPAMTVALAFEFCLQIAGFAQDTTSVKMQFEVENLLPQNVKVLQSHITDLKGVSDCAVAGNRVTVSIKPDEKVMLADLKKALASLKPIKDEKVSIRFNGIKLEGKVTLYFTSLKSEEKVAEALLSVKGVSTAKRDGDGFTCVLKSPDGAKFAELAKAVGTQTGTISAENTALDPLTLIKDVMWHGGPKPAAKDKPGSKPKSGHACKAGACGSGGCGCGRGDW